jgi:hypothetical protein
MTVSGWMRALGAACGIAVLGAPSAALVTLTIALALALIGLVVSFAFETTCEAELQRVPARRTTPTKPDRAVRAGELPVARLARR